MKIRGIAIAVLLVGALAVGAAAQDKPSPPTTSNTPGIQQMQGHMGAGMSGDMWGTMNQMWATMGQMWATMGQMMNSGMGHGMMSMQPQMEQSMGHMQNGMFQMGMMPQSGMMSGAATSTATCPSWMRGRASQSEAATANPVPQKDPPHDRP